jgi:chromosome segregation ATPase
VAAVSSLATIKQRLLAQHQEQRRAKEQERKQLLRRQAEIEQQLAAAQADLNAVQEDTSKLVQQIKQVGAGGRAGGVLQLHRAPSAAAPAGAHPAASSRSC